MVYKFYCDSPLKEGQTIVLSPEESKHAVAVLRLANNTDILLLNGNGTVANATICNAHKTNCEAIIKSIEHQPTQGEFTLLISPPKSTNRWEYIIEKAQELNVSRIQPVVTYHSERKKINIEKANKIARAALKQCGAFYQCEISEPIAFAQALQNYPPGLFGYCKMLNNESENLAVSSVFIGPEGDFSEQEVAQLKSADWQTMRLANNILRSETAAVTAIVKHNPYL
jgi:16S rRNA (uracil1498-N3)-methyltransferase